MKTTGRVLAVLAVAVLAAGAGARAAELVDHGGHGEFFHDAQAGLYWFDPALFVGIDRTTIDVFVTQSSLWGWATSTQIDALVGRTAPDGLSLEEVMGARQFTIGGGGPRWIGYHAGAEQPDGWLVESSALPPFATLTASGFQSNAASWSAGAWLVSTTDPVAAPRLEDFGLSGALFHDQGTGLYWRDPAGFVGQTRAQVETWLLAHANWRWATAEEVAALVGLLSAGDVPLTDILGAPQFTIGNGGPRWIGYYAQETQPDGLLLQAEVAPYFHLVTAEGTQAGAASWSPGAWVVATDPMGPDHASWGRLKSGYR